jgi:hypothetical protein
VDGRFLFGELEAHEVDEYGSILLQVGYEADQVLQCEDGLRVSPVDVDGFVEFS